jgi:hypothetical protein
MEELLENLLFSALFPKVDRWRHSLDASRPSDDWLRAFVRVEMRLQIRYGSVNLEKMVEALRLRALVRKAPMVLLGIVGIPLMMGLFHAPNSQPQNQSN